MRFGPWSPLRQAVHHIPDTSGVFQIKTSRGLIRYPRGLSAMVRYGASPNLKQTIADVARSHPEDNWQCRHLVIPTPDVLLKTLLAQFVARFGATPIHMQTTSETSFANLNPRPF